MRYAAAFLYVASIAGCGPSYGELLAIYNGEREELERLQEEKASLDSENARALSKNGDLRTSSFDSQLKMARLGVHLNFGTAGEPESERIERISTNQKNQYDAEMMAIRIFETEDNISIREADIRQSIQDLQNARLEGRPIPGRRPDTDVVYDDDLNLWMDKSKDWTDYHFKMIAACKKREEHLKNKMAPLIEAAANKVTSQQKRVDEAKAKMDAAHR